MRKLSFEEMENVKGGDSWGIGLMQGICGAVLNTAINGIGSDRNKAINTWESIASTCAMVGVI